MNLGSIPYEEFLSEVKLRVCSLCSKTGADGQCTITGTKSCTGERHLPKIIQVANMINSNNVDDYVSAFREHVCRDCRKDGDTHCTVRESDACGLDKYFPIVVEAIEAVQRRYAR